MTVRSACLRNLAALMRPGMTKQRKGDLEKALRVLRGIASAVQPGTRTNDIPPLILPILLRSLEPDLAVIYVPVSETTLLAAATFPGEFWDSEGAKRFRTRDCNKYGIGRAIRRKRNVTLRPETKKIGADDYDAFSPRVGSELVIPIFVDDVPVAVTVLSRYAGRPFGIHDLAIARAVRAVLSDLYAHALERSRQSATLMFMQRLATLPIHDVDHLLDTALSALSEVIPSKYSSVWLVNRPAESEEQSLALRYVWTPHSESPGPGKSAPPSKVIAVAKSLSGVAVTTGTPQIFDRLATDARYANGEFASRLRLTWFLSVPIVFEAEVLGVINVYPVIERSLFDESIVSLVQVLGNQLATSLRIALLHHSERLMIAYDGAFRVLLTKGDVRQNWDALARLISSQLACEASSIFLLHDDGRLHLVGSTGIEGDPPYDKISYGRGEGLTGQCLERNAAIVYYKELKDAFRGLHISKFREKLPSSGKSRSILLAPIALENEPAIGVIRCNNKAETALEHWGRFTGEDVFLLKRLGRTLADVVRKMDWARKREQRLEQQIHNLHHEVQDPINGIQLLAEDLLERMEEAARKDGVLSLNEQVVRTCESIYEGAVQASMVVKAIGGLDDDIVLNKTWVNVVDVVMTCKRWLKNTFSELQIDLRIEFLNSPKVLVDREHIQRLIYNVLGNAAKYADKKQAVKYVILRRVDVRGRVLLECEDNGIGVPVGEEESVFERGIRGSNVAAVAPVGSGLGLAFCRKIADAHGWEISLKSRAKPTVFLIAIGGEVR
jgi:signal transduction histidine kinase/GAF domain-containing protein